MVDKIWQSLAMCKLNTASYPQNLSTVADDIIPSGSGSVGFNCPQSDYQPQQLILVTTWGCPTWVLRPQPFVDIFWAWCTCHVSCWWSHVTHRPSKNVKVVSSPSLGFVFNPQPLLQYACLIFRPLASPDSKMVDRIWQSLAVCKLNTASYPQNLSTATVADRNCHSKWQWFCGFQLSTIRLSATTARTSNNLRLSNMGTSPSAFRWHLLSKMHMSCILLMISCCSPTLQEYQSGLLSVPGLCLQSSTTASICLLDFSASHIFRRWIRHHTHSHQNGWQDATKFGHVQTKHCYLPSKPFNCGGWCYSGIHYQTISQSSSY